jgi:hypothetical protein
MIVGMKVKGLSESLSWTHVSLKSDDVDVTLTFKNDDPRVKNFTFGSEVVLEVIAGIRAITHEIA